MAISNEELTNALSHIGTRGTPYFKKFLLHLSELLGDNLNVCFRLYNPRLSKIEDTTGITKKSIVILWGDERSNIFPNQFFKKAKALIKYHCPTSWMSKGIIPITDTIFGIPDSEQIANMKACSKRDFNVFFSGNLNYRRLDFYRGLTKSSFGYPFKISACYPVNGSQPLWQKVEAIALQKLIMRLSAKNNFSDLIPKSHIIFTNGFGQGLSIEEYIEKLINTKISICPPGFITNETIRLIESCISGTAVVCGHLPRLPMYEGHPFIEVNDWRKIRKIIDDLLVDPDRLDEIGFACKNWYQTHFSPEIQAKRIAQTILNNS